MFLTSRVSLAIKDDLSDLSNIHIDQQAYKSKQDVQQWGVVPTPPPLPSVLAILQKKSLIILKLFSLEHR